MIVLALLLVCHAPRNVPAGEPPEEKTLAELRQKVEQLELLPRLQRWQNDRFGKIDLTEEELSVLRSVAQAWSRRSPQTQGPASTGDYFVFYQITEIAVLGGIRPVVDALAKVAADPQADFYLRSSLILRLSWSKDPGLVPLFEKLAFDIEEPRLNGPAVVALAYVATKDAKVALADISIRHPDRDSVARAAKDYIEIVDWLMVARDKSKSWPERKGAIEPLAQSPYTVAQSSVEEIKREEEDPEHVKEIEKIQEEAKPIIFEKLRELR
jgi:hypothetical protein